MELSEDGVTIEISIVILYGASVIETAKQVQTNIQQTLQTMTSIDLEAINVHVVGIQFENMEEAEREEIE